LLHRDRHQRLKYLEKAIAFWLVMAGISAIFVSEMTDNVNVVMWVFSVLLIVIGVNLPVFFYWLLTSKWSWRAWIQ
jgi:hypothetical protein